MGYTSAICKMHTTVARRLTREPTARRSSDASFLENPCEYPHKLHNCQKREYLISYVRVYRYTMGVSLSVFNFMQVFESPEKVF